MASERGKAGFMSEWTSAEEKWRTARVKLDTDKTASCSAWKILRLNCDFLW